MGQSRIRRATAFAFGALAAAALLGCATDGGTGGAGTGPGGGSSSMAYAPLSELEPTFPPGGEAGGPAGGPSAPSLAARAPSSDVRVTWEALHVERERCLNPRFGRRPQRGCLPMQKIVLVNETHPDAERARLGRCAREEGGVAVAPLPDRDLRLFVEGLEERGFFRVARPTIAVQHLFEDENARGRVTVERGGESWSLVSMRGQGLNEATKAIPPLYSEVKRAIAVLRNRTPTLSVVGVGRDPIRR